MIDYSKWIGKKVFVSDESVERAQEYKKNPSYFDEALIFKSYDPGKVYPFYCEDEGQHGTCWAYVVLADEEEEEMEAFKFGDLVECRDKNDELWLGSKVYFGKKGDLFLVMFDHDYEELGKDMNDGRSVFPYLQCRKTQAKEYTMEELEKIVGHKFKIKP